MDVKVDDLLIKDSHQFQATNLMIVVRKYVTPIGFGAKFATPNGQPLGDEMMVYNFELTQSHSTFYRAARSK